MADANPDPISQQIPDVTDRRRTARYSCEGHALINTIPNSGIQHKGSLRNLSLGGCSLEFTSPYPLATRLELMLHVNRLSLRVTGIVRNRRPNEMGIQFDLMSAGGRHDLHELIREFKVSQKKP